MIFFFYAGRPIMVNLPWPLALRSQLVPHKLTTVFYPGTFFGRGTRNLPPDGRCRRVENMPWFQDYVHELDKELFFTVQIQHVSADRTNSR